jgi:hypothetical protein
VEHGPKLQSIKKLLQLLKKKVSFDEAIVTKQAEEVAMIQGKRMHKKI